MTIPIRQFNTVQDTKGEIMAGPRRPTSNRKPIRRNPTSRAIRTGGTKRFATGIFQPKNPEKYIGSAAPIYRSSWELMFMNKCDEHPYIIQWASEMLEIPYIHPVDGKFHKYIPDFYVKYIDANLVEHVELMEIKPKNQAISELAKGKNKAVYQVNRAKWDAAEKWCATRNITFRVLTEAELFKATVK